MVRRMAFDEGLAERIRAVLDTRSDVDDRKMFGGIAFLVAGNMACGVMRDDLMVRMEPDDAEALESEPGVRRFDMGGRPMKGWLLVAPEATADDGDLERWVRRGEAFAASLPPK
jgi:TfoX/Sxy family transcriptional regulator of competence genes